MACLHATITLRKRNLRRLWREIDPGFKKSLKIAMGVYTPEDRAADCRRTVKLWTEGRGLTLLDQSN